MMTGFFSFYLSGLLLVIGKRTREYVNLNKFLISEASLLPRSETILAPLLIYIKI